MMVVRRYEFSILAVTYRGGLTRFRFACLEEFFKVYDIRAVVMLRKRSKVYMQELVGDMLK